MVLVCAMVLNLDIAMLRNYYGPILAGNVSKFNMLRPPRYLFESNRRARGGESRNTDVKSGTKRRKYQQAQSTINFLSAVYASNMDELFTQRYPTQLCLAHRVQGEENPWPLSCLRRWCRSLELPRDLGHGHGHGHP